MSQKQNDEEDESSSEKTNVKNFVCQQMNVNVLLLGTNNSTLNAVSSLHRKNTFVRVTT